MQDPRSGFYSGKQTKPNGEETLASRRQRNLLDLIQQVTKKKNINLFFFFF